MNKRDKRRHTVELKYKHERLDRVVVVRNGEWESLGSEAVSFMISGFNESEQSMQERQDDVGAGTTIVYISRRQTAAGESASGLTRQTLNEQAVEVAHMISAYLDAHPNRFKWAVVHGHSMGSVIALRILPLLRALHAKIVWHVIAEAPPPWERAPLWFSNKSFWGNGGWAALRDAMRALATNHSSGKEGMIANSDTLYRLYAGSQPEREDFEAAYLSAIPDAPLAFMELAFKSGLGNEIEVRRALHEGQLQLASSSTPILQIVCFVEDRIFDWQRIIKGMEREARMLTVHGPDGEPLISDIEPRKDTGPTVHVDCIPSLPHVPGWGTDMTARKKYFRAVYNCYRRIMI